jgi:DNA-binding MarR family transcriptional regulator
MTTTRSPERTARSGLEAIVFGAVAVTARALTATGVELTLPQWRALVIVGRSASGASVSDVAERLGSDLSPTSRLIGRLERRGLVATAKSDRDRRVTRVRLTDEGRALRGQVIERRRMLLAEVLAGVGVIDVAGAELLARLGEAFRPFL